MSPSTHITRRPVREHQTGGPRARKRRGCYLKSITISRYSLGITSEANAGSYQSCVNSWRMKAGEGIAGAALDTRIGETGGQADRRTSGQASARDSLVRHRALAMHTLVPGDATYSPYAGISAYPARR
jgi:hypothetical protein